MTEFLCGERMPRGLLCVTVARWIVATVVGALAVTVLLLVLTVGLSSEGKMSVKVSHGHLQVANALWLMNESFNLLHYPNNHQSPKSTDGTYTLAVYSPATRVDIWLSMNFRVPGGCDNNPVSKVNVSVTVFDMPNAPSFIGMVKIATLDDGKPREVCFYHGLLDRWITITDNDTLDYIAKTYGGRSEFTAMLKVNTTTITKATTLGGEPTITTDTHYCWPVTVGHTRSFTAEAITCKPSHGMDYAATAAALGSPAPAPAPAPLPPPNNTPPPPQICEPCAQN